MYASPLNELQSNSTVPLLDINVVQIQLNIDGLPLFKSSRTQCWPILDRIIEPYQSKPFVIELFSGGGGAWKHTRVSSEFHR